MVHKFQKCCALAAGAYIITYKIPGTCFNFEHQRLESLSLQCFNNHYYFKLNKGTTKRSIPSRNENIVRGNALFRNKHVIEETKYLTSWKPFWIKIFCLFLSSCTLCVSMGDGCIYLVVQFLPLLGKTHHTCVKH